MPEETTNYSSSLSFFIFFSNALRPPFLLSVRQCPFTYSELRINHTPWTRLPLSGNLVLWQSFSSETAAPGCCVTSPVAFTAKLNHNVSVWSFRHIATARQRGDIKILAPLRAGAAVVMDDPVTAERGGLPQGSRCHQAPRPLHPHLRLPCCDEFKIDKDLLICTDRGKIYWLPQQLLLLVLGKINLITGCLRCPDHSTCSNLHVNAARCAQFAMFMDWWGWGVCFVIIFT